MSLLATVYASAPAGVVLIPTLEIRSAAFPTIRVCAGFEDITVTLETGQQVTFEDGGIDVSLPARDTSGQQTLNFAVDNVTGIAQQRIDSALQQGVKVEVVYRDYLSTDLSTPASPPLVMTLIGGMLEGGTVQFQASYFDLLNTAWPRERYTVEFAPGLRYL